MPLAWCRPVSLAHCTSQEWRLEELVLATPTYRLAIDTIFLVCRLPWFHLCLAQSTHQTPDSFATSVLCMSLFRCAKSSQGLVLHLVLVYAPSVSLI